MTSPDGWIGELKSQGVARVAQALGLTVTRNAISPCPACGQATRHRKSKDKRGAVSISADGRLWVCRQCEEGGDAVTLAAWKAVGKGAPSRDEWPEVRRACEWSGVGLGSGPAPIPAPVAQAPKRPPAAELAALWAAGTKPELAAVSEDKSDREAARYIASRGINLGDLALFEPEMCRILPRADQHAFPAWWPAWRPKWRLHRWAVRAYETDGTAASIHARAVVRELPDPTKRWPEGVGSGGLLFANRRGAALLRGEAGDTAAVFIAEGLTDTVSASIFWAVEARRFAVLGYVSGSKSALAGVRWPVGLDVFVATDADSKGDDYACEVRAALPAEVVMKRVRLGEAHG